MRTPRASIVIPAHNEEGRITQTLVALTAEAHPGEFDIVVVCNGCTDATVELARSVPSVTVVELEQASKIAALREGDRRSDVFPRIYLDADVVLSTESARDLVHALEMSGAAVAGIPGRMRLDAAPLLVRLYFEFRERLPVMQQGVIGGGVYALSREARSRFGAWPDVSGDDQFVFRLYEPGERTTVPGRFTVIAAPPDLRTVIRRGLRVRRGNRQLSEGVDGLPDLPAPATGFRQALGDALRSPRGVASAIVFTTTALLIRVLDRVGVAGDW